MRNIITVFILVIFNLQIFANDWVKPSVMNEEEWALVKPYLLPYDSDLRKKLDLIFSDEHVIKNERTLQMNHFTIASWKGKNNILVAKNSNVKNYVFKLFLDSQGVPHEWYHYIKRIEGSLAIGKMIASKGFEASFKVPKKCLYLLPKAQTKREGSLFILVAEKIQLKSAEENRKKWKSSKLNETFLKQVYTLINELGLIDSVYIDNIPFSKDGKVAFVDTEHYNVFPVNFKKLEHYLHPTKKKIWAEMSSN